MLDHGDSLDNKVGGNVIGGHNLLKNPTNFGNQYASTVQVYQPIAQVSCQQVCIQGQDAEYPACKLQLLIPLAGTNQATTDPLAKRSTAQHSTHRCNMPADHKQS